MSMHIFTYTYEGGPTISIALAKIQGCSLREHGRLSIFIDGDDSSEESYVIPSYEIDRFKLAWGVFRIRMDRQMWEVMEDKDVIALEADVPMPPVTLSEQPRSRYLGVENS